eukprot:c3046_g1_i2.p1 GENE.c3046_g1_i2~~c3046_g1_i2.p1  ORF type:complete len:268 (-),score=42.90 c3046_g1_i2:62-865(-)
MTSLTDSEIEALFEDDDESAEAVIHAHPQVAITHSSKRATPPSEQTRSKRRRIHKAAQKKFHRPTESLSLSLVVYVSEHAKAALPQLKNYSNDLKPLVQLPINEVNKFMHHTYPGFDTEKELCIKTDGIHKRIGNVGSVVFLMFENSPTTNGRLSGFRSARFCNGTEEFGKCFWLENGVTNPNGHSRGLLFLQLIHAFLFAKVHAANMYLQFDKSNEASKQTYRRFVPQAGLKGETTEGFKDITDVYEESGAQTTHLFFHSRLWEVV